MASCRVGRFSAGNHSAWPARNSGGAVYHFGSSQLLLTLSDGFTINLGFVQIPVQMDIENFDVSPFLCGVIALSLLYAAYASQTLRGALKAVPMGQWEIRPGAGAVEIGYLFPSGDAADVASCAAWPR
ncbi:arginine transport system permease [Escherichia coli]|uniref:Arginine transport system permease n=1 Tax=Escherichia coli TaxID=562 RepID=A0A376MUW8_ECOLX|nr:arginine transport system permease [Escherichia coli]